MVAEAAGDAGARQTAFPAASRLQLSCRSSGRSPGPCRCLSERGPLLSPLLPAVPRLGCHQTRFEGAYLQTCLAEAGNGPVKTLQDRFPQTCALRGSRVSAAVSPGTQCSAPVFASHAPRCRWHPVLLGLHEPWMSFGQTDTPLPHLAPCAPPHYLGSTPQLRGSAGIQVQQAGWDGMGWGRGPWGLPCHLGLPQAEPLPWDASQPGRAPVRLSRPAAGWGVPGGGQLRLFLIRASLFVCFEFAV